ncbi:MFS transporter [Desulfolucanica intricata]|uniref:MFS transporter n=1 Tax=Desulfolucanica intricata TaxID=1285191 RepID=UPI00082F56E6|nr:MFS transporter [Desulfolucanica intricata]
MKKHQKIALASLAGVPLVMVLGNSMLIPVLPDIKSALNLTQFKVSLIITLFSLSAGLIIPFAGFLSDRFGRKKVIVPGLLLYGLGGIIAGGAAILLKQNAYTIVLAGRIIQGIGAAGTAPIAMALCGDLFSGKDRSKSLGAIESSNGFGKVLSPILGSLIGLIAWYATLLFFPIVALPIAAAVWFLVKEPDGITKDESIKKYLNDFKNIFKKKYAMLLSAFLAGSVALMVLFGVLFFLSDYLEKTYKLEGVIKGAALAIPVLFMSVTSYLTGIFIKKNFGLMKILIVTGLFLIAGSLGMLPLFQNTYVFFTAISIAGIGTGLTLPCLNTIITSSAAKEERGLLTSLYGSVRFFGVAAGPPIFGLLMGASTAVMFWSATGLAAISAVLAIFFIKVKEMKDADEPESNKPSIEIETVTVSHQIFAAHPPIAKPLPDEQKEPEMGNKSNSKET